jgi:hypothetical protein
MDYLQKTDGEYPPEIGRREKVIDARFMSCIILSIP